MPLQYLDMNYKPFSTSECPNIVCFHKGGEEGRAYSEEDHKR